MGSVNWKLPISGDWSTASNWSTNSVPNASSDVTISVPGSFGVTINSAAAAHSVTLSNAHATIVDNSSVKLGTALDLAAGTFDLNSGGTIAGGTIISRGSSFVAYRGTLSGVHFDGTLDLTNHSASVTIANGITLAGLNGGGAATINDTGIGGELYIYNRVPTTLNNATINIGRSGGYNALTIGNHSGSGAATTFGPHLDFVQVAGGARIRGSSTLINEGTISAGHSVGYVSIYLNDVTNSGTIAASNGGYDNIRVNTFTNTGLVSASGNARVLLFASYLTNLSGNTLTGGNFFVGAGSTMELGGGRSSSITTDNAGITLSGVGSVLQVNQTSIDQTLDTIGKGGSLTLLAGRHFTATAHGGTFIDDGRLTLGGATFAATALGVNTGGALSGTGTVDAVIINYGIITATGGTLNLQGSTLTNIAGATLSHGVFAANTKSTLQLPRNVAIAVDATRIMLTGAGSVIESLNTKTGKQVTLDQTLATIASSGALTLAGGRVFTAAANQDAFTDKGTLTLADGTFAAASLSVASGGGVSAASGTDKVSAALINAGSVLANGGSLTFSAAVTNNSTMTVAKGAFLAASSSVAGSGHLNISAGGGTLELLKGAATGQTVKFLGAAGLLDLGAPLAFKGTIADFVKGDTIDLLKTVVTSDTFSGGTLTCRNGGITVATLKFSGNYTTSSFHHASDGHAGTLITHT